MTGDSGDSGDSRRGWKAVVERLLTGVLLVVVLGGGWFLVDQRFGGGSSAAVSSDCPSGIGDLPARYASGRQLCAVLNRPDLPELLGTPADRVRTASGDDGWTDLGEGIKAASSMARVDLDTFTVQVSAHYDYLPMAQADLAGGGEATREFLGHRAVVYSDQTMAIAPGEDTIRKGTARILAVARDTQDGSFEISILRQDGTQPDDNTLLRVAEQVLPDLPGWTAS